MFEHTTVTQAEWEKMLAHGWRVVDGNDETDIRLVAPDGTVYREDTEAERKRQSFDPGDDCVVIGPIVE